MHVEEGDASSCRDAKRPRFASRLTDVEENLAFAFREGEGKHVGGVRFLAVGFVEPLRECIAAENEGECKVPPEEGRAHVFKGNGRQWNSRRLSYLGHLVGDWRLRRNARRIFFCSRHGAAASVAAACGRFRNLSLAKQAVVLAATLNTFQGALLGDSLRLWTFEIAAFARGLNEASALNASTELTDDRKWRLASCFCDFRDDHVMQKVPCKRTADKAF